MSVRPGTVTVTPYKLQTEPPYGVAFVPDNEDEPVIHRRVYASAQEPGYLTIPIPRGVRVMRVPKDWKEAMDPS